MADVPELFLSFVVKFIPKCELFLDVTELLRCGKEDRSSRVKVEAYQKTILDKLSAKLFCREAIDKRNMLLASSFNLMIPFDTHVINNMSNMNNQNDLLACPERSPVGFTKLKPVNTLNWKCKLNKKRYVTVFDINSSIIPSPVTSEVHLGFVCDWPPEAAEWLTRKRLFGWPAVETIVQIQEDGARIISARSGPGEECEWKYFLDPAELILTDQAISDDQCNCFRISKIILDQAEVTCFLDEQHLRHTFFYMCEETNPSQWRTNPGECIMTYIKRLVQNVQNRRFDNYFLKSFNMFTTSGEDHKPGVIMKRLSVALHHPFVCLFFLTELSLYANPTVVPLLDNVVENIREYQKHSSDKLAVQHSLIQLAADGLEYVVLLEKYAEALDRCEDTVSELNALMAETDLNLDMILQPLFNKGSFLKQRWLFAFCIDITKNTNFTEDVNQHSGAVVGFTEVFGPSLEQYLRIRKDAAMHFRLPVCLVNSMNVTDTTERLLTILQNNDTPDQVIYSMLKNYCRKCKPSVLTYIQNPSVGNALRKRLKAQMKIIDNTLVIIETRHRISELDKITKM